MRRPDAGGLVMDSGALRYCEIPSPVGVLTLAGDENSLREISFSKGTHPKEIAATGLRSADSIETFREVIAQLEAYFEGRLSRFELPLAPEGTAFQNQCWSMLRTIPYGQTVSYGEIARRVGRPNAFRAVGAANGRNPIPIIIPCHRVVGADGSLTGFGGGLEIKRRLLELEQRHRAALEPGSAGDLWEMTAAESPSAR
jgi:methylated-DNA-[protein]-cysteine S-methyltransferase